MSMTTRKKKSPSKRPLNLLDDLEQRIEAFEDIVETALDTAHLRLYLAEMEAKEKLGEFSQRLGRVQRKVDAALSNANEKATAVFAKLGATCVNSSEK